MKKRIAILTAALFIVSAQTTVASTGEVEKVLKIIDANLTKVKDQTYSGELAVIRGGKTIKTMKFEAIMKGLVAKKIRFTAPGDVRGMSVLTTKDGLMYIYMPSYKRVRRVASHVRNQGFMGTDISAEEMGTASLSEGWHAKISSQDDKDWKLEMTPKKGTETAYSKLKVIVSKKHLGVTKVESYDSKGKLVKTQVRSEWKTFGPINLPTLFVYTDHKTGSKTEMRFVGCKVNQNIPDNTFTKRSLMRGE